MRVALIGVRAGLEPDLPRLIALEGDGRGLVQPRPLEVEVVERGLVLDLEGVRPGLDRLQILAVLLHLDREAWADLADEAARLRPRGRRTACRRPRPCRRPPPRVRAARTRSRRRCGSPRPEGLCRSAR